MSEQSPLASGFYFDRPREGAPSFVKGRLSVQADKAIALINQYKNDKGYINLDLLEAKETKKLYLTVNTFTPKAKTEPRLDNPDDAFLPDADIEPADIPF